MTEEQQRVAVAEALGWTKCACNAPECGRWFDYKSESQYEIPNYPHDANTRPEMLGKLNRDQKISLLNDAFGEPLNPSDVYECLHLDQPTFCRHWLKVVGKWKE